MSDPQEAPEEERTMSTLSEIATWLRENLAELASANHVPAASVGILSGGEVVTAATGVLNKNTGVEADVDSVFQIGSITKTWTASLIMQLVDDGLLDVDAPVRGVLPDFSLADDASARAITSRHLLSHVGGFEGDLFIDTGVGDDCVERYLAAIADAPQLFDPGERFSYNNAGFVVLGRIVEVLREKPFHRALREHLVDPLRLTHVATDASEAIMFRAALGHIPTDGSDEPIAAPVWSLVRSNAPAGSMLAMTARDLLGFARVYMDGGTASDGTRVLSPESVHAMQRPQVKLPDFGAIGNAWGLGWNIFDWEGGPVIGHDGGTVGQSAFLRIVPRAGVAVAILTNGGSSAALYTTLVTKILGELADVRVPSRPTPPEPPVDVDIHRIIGTYSSSVCDSTVTRDEEGRVWLERVMKGIFAELGPEPEPVELVGWRGDTLIARVADHGIHAPHAFVGDDGRGRALFLHTGRADRRVDA